jgi:Na+/citrate or Na+/malate symporter
MTVLSFANALICLTISAGISGNGTFAKSLMTLSEIETSSNKKKQHEQHGNRLGL